MLQAFGLGLIPFSAQYLLLRGFYAFEDTRTPFFMAVCIAAVNITLATACHLLLPVHWAVTGMAAAYTLSYAGGLALTSRLLRKKLGQRLGGDGTLRPAPAPDWRSPLRWPGASAGRPLVPSPPHLSRWPGTRCSH